MPNALLIEIGTEELPASFLKRGLQSRQAKAEEDSRMPVLEKTASKPWARPARRYASTDSTTFGARNSSKKWLDLHGRPRSTRTVHRNRPRSVSRKNTDCRRRISNRLIPTRPAVGVTVRQPARATVTYCRRVAPALCDGISFPKSMRWGGAWGDVAFGRPVQWIVALYGSKILPFSFANIDASNRSRGHRFLADHVVEIASPDDYVGALKNEHVWVSRRAAFNDGRGASVRSQKWWRYFTTSSSSTKMSLVEEPFVVPGNIDEKYLSLLDRHHQCNARSPALFCGALMNQADCFQSSLNVVNTANDPALISVLCRSRRLLRARLKPTRNFL
ncbi:MAG: glycine--tRNA ligase subunit beta [Polyangiales bacterium]